MRLGWASALIATMTREIETKPNFPLLEKEILNFWREKDVFNRLREQIKGKPRWSFLDGPITANNPMGVHHAWGRTYKDVFQRYKAMRGFDQRFQNGFDCQGLWVEVGVEKELGFKTKKDIEEYGIDKFVGKCKEQVEKYAEIMTAESVRLGQWMDWDHSYYTMSDENNYAIWAFLKKCFDKGWLYKGRDVVPWCPRCGTAISQHEILTEEYQELTHNSIYFKATVKGQPNTFFLVWTTTPWTLPADVALAVHPELEYAKVKSPEGEVYILAESKSRLIEGGEIVEKFRGEELDNLEYLGLFDELPAVASSMAGQPHRVVLWQEVTEEDGTGIVHIAPGCGEEDFALGKELGLAVIDPVNAENCYPEGFGEFSGLPVTNVEKQVFATMQAKGLVYKIEPFTHRYPTCWRCKSELIFRLVDEWYIAMDELRPRLMEVVRDMKWIPDFGLERELDWLNNMHDWMISKKRYWGLALPIFECGKCKRVEVIGSRKELQERAIAGWEEFDGNSPHRPWVDRVKIKCSGCGTEVSRISDVGSPWLDAGIVSLSTLKYFEDQDYWQQWFPADLVCESFPGQFKNWFYALIVMSVVLVDSYPTKTVFGYALVRDEEGEEMHKSKGNAIWFAEAVEKVGADPLRWLYVKQKIVNNLRFGYHAIDESARSLITLWNCHKFVAEASSQMSLSLLEPNKDVSSVLDRWILSRLMSTVQKSTRALDEYDVFVMSHVLEDFINDFSTWYIRRSRERVNGLDSADCLACLVTARQVFAVLLRLMAPLTPFLAERMYQNILGKTADSVHLMAWPELNESLLDVKLEEQMDLLRVIVEIGHAERKCLGIKVRQPLNLVTFRGFGFESLEMDKDLLKILTDELNVKKVDFVIDKSVDPVRANFDTVITPELQAEGEARELVRSIQALRKEQGLKVGEPIMVSCPTWPASFEDYLKTKTSALKLTKGDVLTITKVVSS